MTDQVDERHPPVVEMKIDSKVATVTLHRPERMNAWTPAMDEQYGSTLDELDGRPDVRAIVVTGSGKGFCPGFDGDLLTDLTHEHGPGDSVGTVMRALSMRKPLICAINGPCAGIGLVHALACDVRFASSSARLATSFSRRGIAAEFAASWLLPRIVGHANALDLLLSGRTVSAPEALTLGLVNRVVPADQLMTEAVSYAKDLADNCAPNAMAVIKGQIYSDWIRSTEGSAHEWQRVQARQDDELAEGMASYLAGRPPNFLPLS